MEMTLLGGETGSAVGSSVCQEVSVTAHNGPPEVPSMSGGYKDTHVSSPPTIPARVLFPNSDIDLAHNLGTTLGLHCPGNNISLNV